MDVIAQSYVQDFRESFGYTEFSEEKSFEYFSNYCCLSKYYTTDSLTPSILDDTSYRTYNKGVDGFVLMVNGKIITTPEQVDDIISSAGDICVHFIFIESTLSDEWNYTKIHTFLEDIIRFYNISLGREKDPNLKYVGTITEIIKYIYSKSSKLKNNVFPRLSICCTSLSSDVNTLEYTQIKDEYHEKFYNMELFSDVDLLLFGWRQLIDLYKHSQSKDVVEIELYKQPIPLPEMEGVQESYLSLVKFDQFRKLIIDENGSIKNVFIDNIRAYQGDNLVNKEIAKTLQRGDIPIFTAMNNGITIIAGSMSLKNSKLQISDYQIVNGCQTSHVLYQNKDLPNIDNLQVLIKFISSSDNNIRKKIIMGANSQTPVQREQLIALSEVQEDIEDYYNSISNSERLYYERRSKQYMFDKNVPKNRIVTIPIQIMSFVAMFLAQPHNVRGYYGSIVENLEKDNKKIFSDNYKIDMYYTCALALYKMTEMFNKGVLPQYYRKIKFQILLAVRLLAEMKIGKMPPFDTKEMEDFCTKLNTILCSKTECLNLFNKIPDFINLTLGRAPIDKDNASREFTYQLLNQTENSQQTKSYSIRLKYRETIKKLYEKGDERVCVASGLERAVASISIMTQFSKKKIDILAGNLYSLEMNDSDVVESLGDFVERGGKLRMLLYGFDEEKTMKSDLFKRLTSCTKHNTNVEIYKIDKTPRINIDGYPFKYNLIVFDDMSFRLETEKDWYKGDIGINYPVRVKEFQDIIDNQYEIQEYEVIDLEKLFSIKKY